MSASIKYRSGRLQFKWASFLEICFALQVTETEKENQSQGFALNAA